MDLYFLIVFFIFGLVFGSFFNVVGYRLPKKMSLVKPSSHCPQCGHKLSWYELIPVISYVVQGGRCRNCKKKIPIFYPIFEIITGILFSLTYYSYGISLDTFIVLIFISTILIIIVSDILYMIIPDELLIFSIIIIFILKIILVGYESFVPNIFNMILPFAFMYLLKKFGDFVFKKDSLGGGDIKLMLLFGLVLGWKISIFCVVLASFIALPISLINLKNNKSHEIPFGPYLGLSAIICILFKIDWNFILNIIL